MLAKFIPLREAAQIIGVSPKTLENWLAGGYFARTADGKKKCDDFCCVTVLAVLILPFISFKSTLDVHT